jgi:hypothetical protein
MQARDATDRSIHGSPSTQPTKPPNPREALAGYNTTSTSSLSWITSATTSSEFQSRTKGSIPTSQRDILANENEDLPRTEGVSLPAESNENGVENLFNDADFVREQLEIMRQISERCMKPSFTTTQNERLTSHSIPSTFNGQKRPPIVTTTLFSTTLVAQETPPLEVPAGNQNTSLTSTSDSDDYDFVRFLNDPVLIQEQQRILDQVEHQRQQQQQQQQMDQVVDVHTSTALSREVEHLTESMLYASLEHCPTNAVEAVGQRGVPATKPHPTEEPWQRLRREGGSSPKLHPMLITDKSDALSSEETVPTHLDDKVVNYGNGKKVRVKGTKHAWKAVADGKAMLVQCPQCSCVLQVGSTAKLLYCTPCQHVSRIETCQLNPTAISDQDHHQIARIVQEQEMNVAHARKLAKLHRNES